MNLEPRWGGSLPGAAPGVWEARPGRAAVLLSPWNLRLGRSLALPSESIFPAAPRNLLALLYRDGTIKRLNLAVSLGVVLMLFRWSVLLLLVSLPVQAAEPRLNTTRGD